MPNNLEQFRKQLIEFLSKGKKFAIAYHCDADGICSTKIMIEYLNKEKKINLDNIFYYPTSNNERVMYEHQEEDVLKKKHDVILYLDLSTNLLDQIHKLRKDIGLVASIDHHHFNKDMEKNFDLYLNPGLIDGLKKPQLLTTCKFLNTIFYNTKNDWLEIIALEGDVAIPSLPGTVSNKAAQILNLLGRIEKESEPPDIRDKRVNTLLTCLLNSDNIPSFLEEFKKQEELNTLYVKIQNDNNENLKKVMATEPSYNFGPANIYIYEVKTREGYDIVDQILKAHLPYLKYNSTYIIYQTLNSTNKRFQIHVYSNNPFIDCSAITSKRGGGGHANRAGCIPHGTPIETILEQIKIELRDMVKDKD